MTDPSLHPEAPACEVCSGPVADWRLGDRDVVGRCRYCGHVTRDLRRAPAGARAPAYGGDPTLDRWRIALTYRRLRRLLVVRGTRVFEVGYGTGALLHRFLDDGAEVAGTDPGALGSAVDPVVARQGALGASRLEEAGSTGRHDLFLGVHVVEHVDDALALARSGHDLLRPGGLLVLVTPAGDSLGLQRFGSAWWMLEDPTHVRFFSRRSLTLLLREAGFVDVQVRRLVLDSLAVEVASLVRRRRWARLPEAGVLTARSTRVLVLATAPLVVLRRMVRPSWRPTLQVSARRPERNR